MHLHGLTINSHKIRRLKVNIIKKNGKEYFQCEECRLWYLDKGIAQKCEGWCRKNKSCNIEYIKYSVELGE